MSWTDERVEMLKNLLKQGLSASQVAVELGGVTRNAVIGKAVRIGLTIGNGRKPGGQRQRRAPASPKARASFGFTRANSAAATAQQRERQAAAEALREMFAAGQAIDLTPEESATAVRLVDLQTAHCRWPLGDPLDVEAFRFCGAERRGEDPYCAAHCRMAYQPAADRRVGRMGARHG